MEEGEREVYGTGDKKRCGAHCHKSRPIFRDIPGSVDDL